MKMIGGKWRTADRISDRIVDVINSELEVMRRTDDVQPIQLFAGQLLAILSLMMTMPNHRLPELHRVKSACEQCLKIMMREVP